MNRPSIYPTLVLAFLLVIPWNNVAHAWSFIVSKFSAPFNQCKTCHISNSNLAMNPYGEDYMDPTHRSQYANKHPAIPVTGDCTTCHGGSGYPILRSGLDGMDSDLDLFTNQEEFSAGTFPGDATDFPADANAPVITAFSLPATASTLTVAIDSLTATDDVAVTGYQLNVTGVEPAAGDPGWSTGVPTHYTFATADQHTLYVWAKDAAGNISAPASAPVDTTSSLNRVNRPPVAAAGADQVIVEGQIVTLDGSGSSDDVGIVDTAWQQLDGPGGGAIAVDDPLAVVVSDSAATQIEFITPAVGADGAQLTFRLTVTDGDGAQDDAEVQVTVEDNGISEFDHLSNVISIPSAEGPPIAIGNLGDHACTALTAVDLEELPADWQAPQDAIYGFIDFELAVAEQERASVTIYLPSPAPLGYSWYKYSETAGWFDFSRDKIGDGTGDGAVFNADRTQVTIYITDNGDYDDDPTPAIIRDPGGLAQGLSSSLSVGDNTFGDSSGGCFIQTTRGTAATGPHGRWMVAGILILVAAGCRQKGCPRRERE